jgi:hypothetical protein
VSRVCGVATPHRRHTARVGKRTRTPAPVRPRRELPDFTTLPGRVPPEALVTTQPASEAPDPQGGRDSETEFLLRHAGL